MWRGFECPLLHDESRTVVQESYIMVSTRSVNTCNFDNILFILNRLLRVLQVLFTVQVNFLILIKYDITLM